MYKYYVTIFHSLSFYELVRNGATLIDISARYNINSPVEQTKMSTVTAATLSETAVASAASTDTGNINNNNNTNIHPQQQYNDYKQEIIKISNKIIELELDRNEHVLVEETLQPLVLQNLNRKAYRLVGEILVEHTIADVLPSVTTNRENMDQTIKVLREQLEIVTTKASELKSKYTTITSD